MNKKKKKNPRQSVLIVVPRLERANSSIGCAFQVSTIVSYGTETTETVTVSP